MNDPEELILYLWVTEINWCKLWNTSHIKLEPRTWTKFISFVLGAVGTWNGNQELIPCKVWVFVLFLGYFLWKKLQFFAQQLSALDKFHCLRVGVPWSPWPQILSKKTKTKKSTWKNQKRIFSENVYHLQFE